MTVRLVPGDCLEAIPQLVAEGVLVDAIVTDPPYHLTSGNAVYDLRLTGSGNPRVRRSTKGGGFMGQTWDGGDIAFRPETWATIGTALKPGGYLLAFGGTRTHHRIWSAIEDAGFVIQDTILWLYGSGFPKGRTQLKPAFEPICVAYKPGDKRTLQIDECRVETDWNSDPTRRGWQGGKTDKTFLPGQGAHRPVIGDKPLDESRGRWPANLAHDGSDEVMEAFAAFGRGCGSRRANRNGEDGGSVFAMHRKLDLPRGHDAAGTAARFFYCAKADGEDRWGSKHPTVKPFELIRWLVRLVTPQQGIVLDPFAGSGTTAIAAMATGRNAILIERDETYQADIKERLAHYEGTGRHSLVARNRNKRTGVGALRDGGRLEADADRRSGNLPLFEIAQNCFCDSVGETESTARDSATLNDQSEGTKCL